MIKPRSGPRAPDTSRTGVLHQQMPVWYDPEDVYEQLVLTRPHHVWRDQGVDAGSGSSFLGWPGHTSDVLQVTSDGRLLDGFGSVVRPLDPTADPLVVLTAAMTDRLQDHHVESSTLGWWGWIGYELCSAGVGVSTRADSLELGMQMFVDRGIEFDHVSKTVTLVALLSAPDADAWIVSTAAWLSAQLPAARSGDTPAPTVQVIWRHDRDEYVGLIGECKAAISRGDAYQLCLTDRATVESATPIDPLRTIRRLRRSNPAPQAGVVRAGGHWLISASPEDFLRVDSVGHASSSPIKGTRRRSNNVEEDLQLIEELVTSEKERAENLMIVDLMRNDLSRISRTGSLEVTRLFGVDSYASVHQLVSTVEADLTTDVPTALAKLVPPGSMTGAPKRSAVSLLQRLEAGPRGIYSGVWGRCSVDGSADIAVVIRSIEINGHVVTIGSGGGITAMSEPSDEWDEVMLKARPLIRATGVEVPADN